MSLVRQRSNLTASTALAVLGAATVLGSSQYGFFRHDGQVGMGFLPAICGVALFVLAALDLMRQLVRRAPSNIASSDRGNHQASDIPADDTLQGDGNDRDIFGRDQATRNRQLATVLVALTLAALAVPLLGLILSLAILMLFISVFVERRRFIGSLLITFVTTATFYLVFVVLLDVPMPRGILGVM